MNLTDPVADMLTKVRNAAMARHEKVDVPASKLKLEIVKILKTEGYIKNFKKVQEDGHNTLRIFLKYDDENNRLVQNMESNGRFHTAWLNMIYPRVDLGVLLSSKIEEKIIAGKKVFNVADGFLIACFDIDVTEETVKAVAQEKPY